ncbi:MAG: 6-phosphogluconolactonase [Chlamydiae bacterium]|nr:MAG: 6-phosphogluconolactonase [Chlamydiota bacterium]
MELVSKKDFYKSAAEFIFDSAEKAIQKNGTFSVALSGGTTPIGVYKLLADLLVNRHKMLNAIHIFWGDERCVPYDDERSNYKSAYDNFLSKINIPKKNIHKIPFIINPAKAAIEYEKDLKRFFKTDGNFLPEFDLILLGMGTDGHTASLFPRSKALNEKERWVIDTEIPEMSPRVERITLTLPVINNARSVLFLISGEEKKKIIDEIIKNEDKTVKKYPAAMVKPRGKITWMIC